MVIKLPYESKRITLTKANISWFKRMETARPVSIIHVNELKKALLSNRHFLTQVAINDRSVGSDKRVFVIIDGAHRITAISEIMDHNSNFEIQVEFQIFRDLTANEEVELFNRLNAGKPQTRGSRLWVNQHKYRVVELMNADFPAGVYFADGQNIRHAFNGIYLIEAQAFVGYKAHVVNAKQFEQLVFSMGEKEYKMMRDFAEMFVDVFGLPDKRNRFSKHMSLLLLYRFWSLNVHYVGIPKAVMKERFSRLLDNSEVRDAMIIASPTGRADHLNVQLAANTMLTVMNKYARKDLVKSPYEEWTKNRPQVTLFQKDK